MMWLERYAWVDQVLAGEFNGMLQAFCTCSLLFMAALSLRWLQPLCVHPHHLERGLSMLTGSSHGSSWRDWLGLIKGAKDSSKHGPGKQEYGLSTGLEQAAQQAPKKTQSAFANMSQRHAHVTSLVDDLLLCSLASGPIQHSTAASYAVHAVR